MPFNLQLQAHTRDQPLTSIHNAPIPPEGDALREMQADRGTAGSWTGVVGLVFTFGRFLSCSATSVGSWAHGVPTSDECKRNAATSGLV